MQSSGEVGEDGCMERTGHRPTHPAVFAVVAALVVAVVVAVTVGEQPAAESTPTTTTLIEGELLPPIAPMVGPAVDGGVFLTRLSNVTVEPGEVLAFDHAVTGGEPVVVVPVDGWYWVGVNLTTLGTYYGGPPNTEVQISVVKNWDRTTPYLTSTVAAERFHNRDGGSAEVNSLLQPVPLTAGDRLEVVLTSPSGLLVESNPSDGQPGSFTTDDGPGTLSPHFYLLPL
jgi:hypothetical protein